MKDESKKEKEIRLGLRPCIVSDSGIIDSEKRRTWVDSENMPWFPWNGFRVLVHNQILQWKKSWWIFGKWIKTYNKSDFDEVCVLDEGWVR